MIFRGLLRHRRRACSVAILAFLFHCNCRSSTHAAPQASATDAGEAIGYEPGDWRLDSAKQNAARFNAAQILIGYRDARRDTEPSPFPGALPDRSRDEALVIARDLLSTLRAHPDRFAELARAHSDDPLTRSFGGLLGVTNPPSLPDAVSDALHSIAEGELSRIVESGFGFHIVRRLPLPPDDVVAAREILIAYKGSDFVPRLGRVATLDRAEAMDLAKRVAAEAKANPSAFPALVQKHSDSSSAVNDGDVGAWKPSEMARFPLVTYSVGQLKAGEISDPVETRFGFHILMRTTEVERAVFDVSEIIVTYEGAPLRQVLAERALSSREEAKKTIDALFAVVTKTPEKFDALALTHCRTSMCLHRGRVGPSPEGRGEPEFELALRGVPVGGLAKAPVETAYGFHILRREDPATYTPPSRPTADDVLRRAHDAKNPAKAAEFVADRLRLFAEDAAIELDLSGAEAAKFAKAMLDFSEAVRAKGVEAIPALNDTNKAAVSNILGGERLARFLKYRDEWTQRRTFVYGLDPGLVPRDPAQMRQFFEELRAKETSLLPLEGQEASSYARIVSQLVTNLDGAEPSQRRDAILDVRKELMNLLGRERFLKYHEIQRRWLAEEARAARPAASVGP